jgi:hypothetical protein
MVESKKKVTMAGVAEGKKLIGIPTGNNLSPEERVLALFHGSMSEEMYQVSTTSLWF